jgi:heme-degrading monooxygenase HmoA
MVRFHPVRIALAGSVLAACTLVSLARARDSFPHPIARIWKGRTLATKADEYQRYLDSSGISRILATPGNRGVTVMRRAEGGQVEFTVLSVWDSIQAVQKFAGEDYGKAVILPRDREYLVSVEPDVVHCEIVREERRSTRSGP